MISGQFVGSLRPSQVMAETLKPHPPECSACMLTTHQCLIDKEWNFRGFTENADGCLIRNDLKLLSGLWRSWYCTAHVAVQIFFANFRLVRNPSHLLKFQRSEQFLVTPDKSKTGQIVALCVIVGRGRDFCQKLLSASGRYLTFGRSLGII